MVQFTLKNSAKPLLSSNCLREGAEEGASGRRLREGGRVRGVRGEPDRGADRAVRARGRLPGLRQEDARG